MSMPRDPFCYGENGCINPDHVGLHEVDAVSVVNPFFKGLVIATLISLPFWAALAWWVL